MAFKAEIEEIIKPPQLKENEVTHMMWAEWQNITQEVAKGDLSRGVKDGTLKRRWVKLHSGRWAWAYSKV